MNTHSQRSWDRSWTLSRIYRSLTNLLLPLRLLIIATSPNTLKLWENCHPMFWPLWLRQILQIAETVPQFDNPRLVAPRGCLHATTTTKVLPYLKYFCAQHEYVKFLNQSNSSIKLLFEKSGFASDDVCYIDLILTRIIKPDLKKLSLSNTREDKEAEDRPYDFLELKRVLGSLREFWNWAVTTSNRGSLRFRARTLIKLAASLFASWTRTPRNVSRYWMSHGSKRGIIVWC